MLLDGRLTTVIVPREACDAARQHGCAYHLTYAVVDYVNDVMRAGVFMRQELPPVAMQAYHADLYLAEVNNGGHSQFIGNVGSLLDTACADASAGLQAMGATAQHRILTDMMAWVKANPAEVANQDGFSERAPFLDELDDRFYEAEQQSPMTDLSSKWIANWPELRAVPQVEYRAEIDRLAQLNPYLVSRRIWQAVQPLRQQMTGLLQVTVAAACGAVIPEPEAMLAIRAGGVVEIGGTQCNAFGVDTDKGRRLCVIEDAGGRLYERIMPASSAKHANSEGTRPWLVTGERLAVVSAATIRRFIKISEQTLAAEAIDLLFRKAGLNSEPRLTAWRVHDDSVCWIAATEQTQMVATIFGDRAVLARRDGRFVLALTRAEIEAHAAEAAAGRDAMHLPPA